VKIEKPVDDYVARLVAEAPPLTPEQRDRLTVLLADRAPAYPSDPARELAFRTEQAQRKLRAAAASRLPPLDDGRRDPLRESA